MYKAEIELQMQKTNLWLPGGSGEGRINWEIRIDIYTLLYIEQITTWVRSLGWEDPLENGMATYSSILAWRIQWTEELQSTGGKESDMTE